MADQLLCTEAKIKTHKFQFRSLHKINEEAKYLKEISKDLQPKTYYRSTQKFEWFRFASYGKDGMFNLHLISGNKTKVTATYLWVFEK